MTAVPNCVLLFKLEFDEVFVLFRAASQQGQTNQPFGVSSLRRVSFPSPEKTRKGRLRGIPLEIPMKNKPRKDCFRHLPVEQAKHLPRCRYIDICLIPAFSAECLVPQRLVNFFTQNRHPKAKAEPY